MREQFQKERAQTKESERFAPSPGHRPGHAPHVAGPSAAAHPRCRAAPATPPAGSDRAATPASGASWRIGAPAAAPQASSRPAVSIDRIDQDARARPQPRRTHRPHLHRRKPTNNARASSSSSKEAVQDRRLGPDQAPPPYLFARINKMKYEKRVAGVDIIDLGMGNPTDPTPECVVDKLKEAAVDPRNHRYSVSNGIAGLRREVAIKYKKKYDVDLDAETEVIATIGSKEGSATCASRCSARATRSSSATRRSRSTSTPRPWRGERRARAARQRPAVPRPHRAGDLRAVPDAEAADPQLPAQPGRP